MKPLFRLVALQLHHIKRLPLGYLYGYHFSAPSKCASQTGATTLDVYRFADENNVTAVGGAVSTIAWHGGWVIVRK